MSISSRDCSAVWPIWRSSDLSSFQDQPRGLFFSLVDCNLSVAARFRAGPKGVTSSAVPRVGLPLLELTGHRESRLRSLVVNERLPFHIKNQIPVARQLAVIRPTRIPR